MVGKMNGQKTTKNKRKDNSLKLKQHVVFIWEALKDFEQVSSIIPSSRFLERRLIKQAHLNTAKTVVELGAGTGGTTMAILKAMRKDARLLSIEINPRFYEVLQRIDDERLIAHLGSADELQAIMQQYGLPQADVIFSGIPFSRIDKAVGKQILAQIAESLTPGGRFIAYQLRGKVEELGKPYLGEAQVSLELLNIPPLRVFQWQK
jgi:phospholipid N-methyltransferase